MLQVFRIESIKDLAGQGKTIAEIAKIQGIDYKTAKRYVEQEDFNQPVKPIIKHCSSILDPYKDEIRAMIVESSGWSKKQRFTSKRIWTILMEKHQEFNCSYNVVVRFVKAYKQEQRVSLRLGYDELVWHPGEAQVDFGEADFCIGGRLERLKYLVVSFPASNMAFAQIFRGETSECVCQGLKDIFEYIGGVPFLLVFDNATGVGRRIGDVLQMTKLFTLFRMHYGFLVRFCNPYSGNEKGNVESNVGYIRRNLFVPPLEIPQDIASYNTGTLLTLCHDLKAGIRHYKHQLPVSELFKKDTEAFKALPQKPFEVFSRQTAKTDGYGRICLDSKHFYTMGGQYGDAPVIVDVAAWTVTTYDANGSLVGTMAREYGSERTSSQNIGSMLASLSRKPGSWGNSFIREEMLEGPLKSYLDSPATTRRQTASTLELLEQLTRAYPYDVAQQALEECLKKGSDLRKEGAITVANRLMTFDLGKADNVTGVDLNKYNILLPRGGEESNGQ